MTIGRKAIKAFLSKAWIRSPLFKVILAVFLFGFITVSGTFLYLYVQYSRLIDRKLTGEVFKNTARIYAAPFRIYPGQRLTIEATVARLQRAGFDVVDKAGASDGVYEVKGKTVTIRPNLGDALRLDFQKTTLGRIIKVGQSDEVSEAWLPAELLTNLFDESREKRRLVEFNEIPKVLQNALIASEDRRFYQHYGLDPIRLVGAVVDSVRRSDRIEGTSTLTQQVARNFFLTLDRSLTRKFSEMFIAVMLEQRLTKEQILTLYANEVYLGNRGSFSIHGFGEGAAAYFGKDIGEVTLAEAATLVGIVPSPNAFNPSKYPDRAKIRRNIVLTSMHTVGVINSQEFEKAKTAEVAVAPIRVDGTDAPFLVDFIREQLEKDYSEESLINDNLKVYTTLDPALQRAAVEAVDKGLKEAIDQIEKRNKGRKNLPKLPDPQAALIAINPHTGEIKAMVGGSNYAASQYNRITQAFRQPGSIFKPFVYAAAFERAFNGYESSTKTELPPSAEAASASSDHPEILPILHRDGVVTPITQLLDEPTTFFFENNPPYEPNNFHQQYRGIVTVREALQHSLNIPTVKVAEQIGYDRVAELARRAGLNAKIKGYPSVALGAFEVTPLEMAGAYTIFANGGQRMEPHALTRVSSVDGKESKRYSYEPQPVIRPELAYLMTHLMEGVMTNGTGAGVRARGFTLPAAGKTGTSRDGWFAGYTKDLLVIAWVGYDDNHDLNLEGSRSALPIWTDFMLKAYQIHPPQDPDAMYFGRPSGIDFVRLDRESLGLAAPTCPDTFEEVFISGTAPTTFCPIHGFRISEVLGTGVEAVGDGLKQTGSAVGRAVKGVGRFFGNVFGRDNNDRPKDQPLVKSPTP